MFEKVLYTIIRAIITYIFALFLVKIMGRKLISQMTFFDFVVGVTMGAIVASVSIGSDNTAVTAASALTTFSALAVITSFVSIKSFRIRKMVRSEPVTMIDNGNIVEDNLKRTRLTIEELNMKLREKNIFSLADVEFAIMEADGEISVLPKADKIPLTPSHMNIQTTSVGLMRDVIIDGVIMEENLRGAGLSTEWLQKQLNAQGIRKTSEVFYAGVDNVKKLYLSKKNAGNTEEPGKYGIE